MNQICKNCGHRKGEHLNTTFNCPIEGHLNYADSQYFESLSICVCCMQEINGSTVSLGKETFCIPCYTYTSNYCSNEHLKKEITLLQEIKATLTGRLQEVFDILHEVYPKNWAVDDGSITLANYVAKQVKILNKLREFVKREAIKLRNDCIDKQGECSNDYNNGKYHELKWIESKIALSEQFRDVPIESSAWELFGEVADRANPYHKFLDDLNIWNSNPIPSESKAIQIMKKVKEKINKKETKI